MIYYIYSKRDEKTKRMSCIKIKTNSRTRTAKFYFATTIQDNFLNVKFVHYKTLIFNFSGGDSLMSALRYFRVEEIEYLFDNFGDYFHFRTEFRDLCMKFIRYGRFDEEATIQLFNSMFKKNI